MLVTPDGGGVPWVGPDAGVAAADGEMRSEVALKKLTGSLIVLVVVGLALGVWALTHTERPVAGATFVGLVSGCRLEIYDAPLEPQVTARLACPGQDWIQLWPLPMLERLFAGRIDAFIQQLDLREAFEGMVPRINMP